jgi:cobalt/nickel transport system permease protein
MNRKIPAFLLTEEIKFAAKSDKGKLKLGFIDRTLKKITSFVSDSIVQYESADHKSIFRRISAPAMLLFFIGWIICISLTHTIRGQLFFSAAIFLFMLISGSSVRFVYGKILLLSILFGLFIMIPAAFNIFSPGQIILPIIKMETAKSFLIYHIPAEIGITKEGALIVIRMFLKVMNSISLTFFILYTVSFNRLVKALHSIKIPAVFILILTLSYKYIFILSHTVEEMYMALKARWMGNVDQGKTRRIIAGRIGFLYKKSWGRYEDTYRAMLSRGYTGDLKIAGTEKPNIKDMAIISFIIAIGIINCIF